MTTTRKNIKDTIQDISNLPSHPIVIERITKLLANPRTSAEEIGRAITADQALAAKVLKLVNSAFYGFPGRISTLSHAIVILGFSTIKNIVLTASIFDSFRGKGRGIEGFNLEQFWYHSIACGAAAQSLSRAVGNSDKEECFIAGLIHDIGKIILCHYLPEDFGQVITHTKEKDILFYESEKALFDICHDEIGGYLAQRWNLPKSLQNAVRYHHHPSPTHEHYMVSVIIHAADIFIRALDYGNGGDDKIPVISENAWKSLDLDNVSFNTLFDGIKDEIEKASVFFQLT
ncbi:MAG: HDOD domain-containing protein [Chitinispirillaceae bacterium]|nr:HDOD domain-containing protein [Chitinispirillaceae bacterium]